MPRLSQAQAESLNALAIEAISAIPPDFPLTARQIVIRDAIATGRPFVAADLARVLCTYAPPACYLDFEAMMPPIPLYEGTRPYQTIPFQWSLHTLAGDGALHHREFLAEGDGDPRRAFAETLIEAVSGADFPIIVYSHYEQTRLKELAGAFPDLRDLNHSHHRSPQRTCCRSCAALSIFRPRDSAIRSSRLDRPCVPISLMTTWRISPMAWRLPQPFSNWHQANLTCPEEVEGLRTALRCYCHRDTLAMVEVHRALMRLGENPDD